MSALSRKQYVLALGLGLCYAWLVLKAIGYAAAAWLPDPLAFLPMERITRILLASDLLHLLAVSVAALPVALALWLAMPVVASRGALVAGLVPVALAFAQTLGSAISIAALLDPVSMAFMAWASIKVWLVPLLLVVAIARVAPPNKPLVPNATSSQDSLVASGQR